MSFSFAGGQRIAICPFHSESSHDFRGLPPHGRRYGYEQPPRWRRRILPLPILPELAAALSVPRISSAGESATNISSFTLGRRSTVAGALRGGPAPRWRYELSATPPDVMDQFQISPSTSSR